MTRRRRQLPWWCALAIATACTKTKETPPSTPPSTPAPAAEPQAEAEEPEAEAEKSATELRVATFNLQWAHDAEGEATAQAKVARAKDEKAWAWKVDAIAKVLADRKPDIVALEELGGEDELQDILDAIAKKKGPEYDSAFVASKDPFSGHQLAVLSKYPLVDARRFDIHLRRHLAVDVQLPEDQEITVVALHAPEGDRARDSRRKQITALKRVVEKLRAKHPVLVMGTLGAGPSPTEDGYADSSAGILSGRSTRGDKDDCSNAVDVGIIVQTTRERTIADDIFGCGLKITSAEADDEGIVKGLPDDADKPWSEVPAKDGERDVSDHYYVWATVERPRPPPPEPEPKPAEESEGSEGAEATAEAAASG